MMVELSRDECLYALGTHSIGRLCLVIDGTPVAFPVNYRLVVESPATSDETENVASQRVNDAQFVIVFRAREGGALDHPGTRVGFQIDGTDPVAQTGWSVLARGTLHEGHNEAAPDWLHSWDPHPWTVDRETWLYVLVEQVSGRQLIKAEAEWDFEIRGYL